MITVSVLAILLIISMILTHADRIVAIYCWTYRKLIKPKFIVGEFVLIRDIEFEIIMLSKNSRPYTYFCLPVNSKSSKIAETYYHESEIKKKTGLLKELE